MKRAAIAILLFVSACTVELRGAEAQSACSEINAAFCERLSDCEGAVNEETCVAADDGLGGPCADATLVTLEADAATCAEAVREMECARIEQRTSPDFDLDCVREIEFE
jgi:hypothetical protein